MRDCEGSLLLEIGNSNNCAHLPARTTRLLNRSRLQQQQYPSTNVNGPTSNSSAATSGAGGGADSDSSRSTHSLRRSAAGSRSSIASTSSTNAYLPPNASYAQQKPFQHHYSQLHRDVHSSSDDLMLYDKSFRNAMIQDVLQFKKQLLRLRRILQETETLNPFDSDNGQLFEACCLDSKLLDNMDLASLTSSTTEDPMMELADLRRQVVYLEGEVEDRERTIRLQKNQIENLESKKPSINTNTTKECINSATQTERTRPFSYGAEGLSSTSRHQINLLHLACICKQKTKQIFNYLITQIHTKHFASSQILIASFSAAVQRFFIIIHRKLQHFKDNFGGIVIGCLNGFTSPNIVHDGSCGGTVDEGGGNCGIHSVEIFDDDRNRQSCLSRIDSTLQRLVAFACDYAMVKSRSKPEYTSYTTHYHPAACCDPNSICNSATNNNICTQHKMQHHHHCNVSNNNLPANATEAALQQHQQIRRHTIISTTLSNYNKKLALAPRRASIAWETSTPATAPTPLTQPSTAIGTTTHAPTANIYKPVKITLIGEPLKQWQWNAVGNGKSAAKVKINGNNTGTISNGNNNYVDGGSGSGDCERSKDTICNGSGRNSISNLHSSDISKETISNGLKNGCNGYANGNSTKTNECNGDGQQNVNNVVVMNGQQKLANSQLNHHSHHRHNRQIQQALLQPAQQQTHTQEASKNTYQQLQH